MSNEAYIGLDVGGTTAKIGLVDNNGAIIEKTKVHTLKSNDWQQIIDEYLRPVDSWFKSGRKIKGIGIGTPGFVNKKTGVLHNCENIPGLINAPFLPYIKERYKVPVYADNDATCATVGEYIFGEGKKFSDFILVTVGTGIGGGLVLDNKVYRGAQGYAGELGHMIVVAEGRGCSCGNRGCIESYSSATSIIKRIKDGIKKGYIRSYDNVNYNEINAQMVFEKAMAGDPHSIDAVDSAARYLGRQLGGIINLLNLQAIIIGGGVAAAGNYYIDKVRFYLEQVAWYAFTKELSIVPAKLLNDAGIIGAASLVLEHEKEKSQ